MDPCHDPGCNGVPPIRSSRVCGYEKIDHSKDVVSRKKKIVEDVRKEKNNSLFQCRGSAPHTTGRTASRRESWADYSRITALHMQEPF